jgi:hypothetical protein
MKLVPCTNLDNCSEEFEELKEKILKNEWTREAESELAKLSVLLKTSLLYKFLSSPASIFFSTNLHVL